ncbi:Hypothetical protein CINCED_3A021485 [Cinara cedri]|uniref:Uncharacterized protein n=1 Tax=Cinara cedri TaxID=506608 RepID=A0A5E4MAN2_9HEMI|nr:Hypothetical protein CINCED_3A021485 [Cinara cedri]
MSETAVRAESHNRVSVHLKAGFSLLLTMSLTKKQKCIIKLLLLQQVEEEQTIIKYAPTKNKNEVHETYLARKAEGFFSVLIEKRLWRDETKFREFFRLNWDQFNYILNLVVEGIKTNPSIKIIKPITAAEKLAVTLS